MSKKFLIPMLTAGCLFLMLGNPVSAANINTNTAIGISPNPVTEGNSTTVTATLTNASGGTFINGGDVTIYKATNKDISPVNPSDPAIGDPVQCGFGGESGGSGNYPHITWVPVNSGTTSGSGTFNISFATSIGMGGKNIGFLAEHPNQNIGGNNLHQSESACLDLTVNSLPPNPGCTPGATITATRVDGDGTPVPGSSGPWTFRITVTACGELKDVTAQGGANGWAPVTGTNPVLSSYPPAIGQVAVRKSTGKDGKNSILLWNIGDMTDGQMANLDVTVSGTIPNSAHDCELRYLSGPWSAIYTLPLATTSTKSSYTGRTTITVDTNDDGNLTCP